MRKIPVPSVRNLCLAFLASISLMPLLVAAAPAVPNAAVIEDRIQQRLTQIGQTPALRDVPVTLVLEADPGRLNTTMLAPNGGVLRYVHGRLHEVAVPGRALAALLSHLPPGVLARFPYPHQATQVVSQGVSLTGAGDMQTLGNSGAGVKIGIIDLGFASLAASQAAGELPSNLTIVDYTGTGTGGTDHGTNVAEIVHDEAPGSTLYLAKVGSDVQLAQAESDMAAAGVRVISHSVAWYGAAFYDGTGPICDVANNANAAGVQWVNAMGNSRLQHYLKTFTDSNNNLQHEFTAGIEYNAVSLTANSPISLILNWNAYPTTTVDYDLYLYKGIPGSGGSIVASSKNKQSGKGTAWFPYPYEEIDYTPTATGTYYVVITKATSATPNLPLTLFSIGTNLGTNTTASSLLQPADCLQVLSVGATDLNDNPEYFSSEGPTTDGRAKPEVAGPDRVQTSLSALFAGTSASTPHISGAIALLMAKNPGMSLAQIKTLLTSAANIKDITPAGYDYRTGYGRTSLDADGDGLSRDLELALGTNPLLADTDGDGLNDYVEVAYDGNAASYTPGADLNPLSVDTDGDGLADGSDPLPLTFNFMDGDLGPLGAPDGLVDTADYAVALQIVLGKRQPTVLELSHGDIYPPGAPDGVIDTSDLVLLLRKLH